MKRHILNGLAWANKLKLRLGITSEIIGGPLRVDNYQEAGGKKIRDLMNPRVITLKDPLLNHGGNKEIQEIKFQEVSLWMHENVRILPGAYGGLHAISENDHVIPGLNHRDLDENGFFETRRKIGICRDTVEFGFLLDGCSASNHYHWIIDALPALFFALEKEYKGLKYLVNPYNQMRRSQFKELGLEDSIIENRGPIRVRRLLAIHGLHPELYGVFRPEPCLGFWDGFEYPRVDGGKIFVSREDTRKRALVNESVLWNRLKKQGFKRVILEGNSLSEQAGLFSSAEAVVGMHGAGFANLIHCKEPGFKFVEIFPPKYQHGFYQYISWLRGGRYWHFECEEEKVVGENPDFNAKNGRLNGGQIDEICSILSDPVY